MLLGLRNTSIRLPAAADAGDELSPGSQGTGPYPATGKITWLSADAIINLVRTLRDSDGT